MVKYVKYRSLAVGVILQAISDYMESFVLKPRNQFKNDSEYQNYINRMNRNQNECYRFMTCKTEIGTFWFDMANIEKLPDCGKLNLFNKLSIF